MGTHNCKDGIVYFKQFGAERVKMGNIACIGTESISEGYDKKINKNTVRRYPPLIPKPPIAIRRVDWSK